MNGISFLYSKAPLWVGACYSTRLLETQTTLNGKLKVVINNIPCKSIIAYYNASMWKYQAFEACLRPLCVPNPNLPQSPMVVA
jgi:hypothetical protein